MALSGCTSQPVNGKHRREVLALGEFVVQTSDYLQVHAASLTTETYLTYISSGTTVSLQQ